MTPPRADVERLLRQGLSLRQAAGALGVPLDVALAALEGPAAVVAARRAAPAKAPKVVAEGAA